MFKKTREKYYLSQEFVSRETGISLEILERLENEEDINENYSVEILRLLEFYDIEKECLSCDMQIRVPFIARHSGVVNEEDKEEINRLYKLQKILS